MYLILPIPVLGPAAPGRVEVMDALARWAGVSFEGRSHVFSTAQWVLDAAREAGHTAALLDGPGRGDSLLPPGGTEALERFAALCPGCLDREAVVADPLGLDDADLSLSALARFRSEDALVLLGTSLVRDHPCQRYSAYRVQDMGLVTDAGTDAPVLLERRGRGCSAVFRPDWASGPLSGLFRLYARLGGDTLLVHEHHLSEAPERIELSADLPDAPLLYAVLEDAAGGADIYQEPYVRDNGLWRIQGPLMTVLDSQSGRQVHGRQGMHEVVQVDGTLAVGRIGDLLRAGELLESGEAAGFRTDVFDGSPGAARDHGAARPHAVRGEGHAAGH